MDASIRLQILTAIASAIAVDTRTVDGVEYARPEGLTVSRDRLQEWAEDELLPVAFVYVDEDEGERVGGRRGPITEREVDVIVEVLAKVPRTVDPDDVHGRYVSTPLEDVTDPLLSWVVACVMADDRLGGLSNSIQEVDTDWDSGFLDYAVAAAGVRFRVSYHTRAHNLARR